MGGCRAVEIGISGLRIGGRGRFRLLSGFRVRKVGYGEQLCLFCSKLPGIIVSLRLFEYCFVVL